MDYNAYVNAINKVFECLAIMKETWPNQGNLANIEKVEEYKQSVVEKSKIIQVELAKRPKVEELGE